MKRSKLRRNFALGTHRLQATNLCTFLHCICARVFFVRFGISRLNLLREIVV